MIEYISGTLVSLNPATAVIETRSGVGFLLHITLNTFSALEGRTEARLLVHEAIREDAWTLFGFINEDERELFRLLVGVSGVGATSARMILSALRPADLRATIAADDAKRLTAVKGIGAKTAQRIIVDLRDKIKADPSTLVERTRPRSAAYDEALEALVILGFARPASVKALDKLFEREPELTVESAVKRAMSML